MIVPAQLVWYFSNDIANLEVVRSAYADSGVELLLFPTAEEVRSALKEGRRFSVFHSRPPYEEFEVFVEVSLSPLAKPYTAAEKLYEEKLPQEAREKFQKRILESRLRLKIHYPSLNFSNLVGYENLKEELTLISQAFSSAVPLEIRPRGLFLVGVPGVGKSYSAKCFAGQMGWPLVELNLSRILELERFTYALEQVFETVESLDGVVLWIDEIEKVFSQGDRERKLMGQLLTILEELNSPVGYRLNGVVWATANDVRRIVENNPEFFGRFDSLFFIDLPKVVDSYSLLEYYFRAYSVSPPPSMGDAVRVAQTVVSYFSDVVEVPDGRFPYTPREVNKMAKRLSLKAKLAGRDYFLEEELRDFLRRNAPVVKQFSDAIRAMRSQKIFFQEV